MIFISSTLDTAIKRSVSVIAASSSEIAFVPLPSIALASIFSLIILTLSTSLSITHTLCASFESILANSKPTWPAPMIKIFM